MSLFRFLQQRENIPDISIFLGNDEQAKKVREFNSSQIAIGVRKAVENLGSIVFDPSSPWSYTAPITIQRRDGEVKALDLSTRVVGHSPITIPENLQLIIQLKEGKEIADRSYVLNFARVGNPKPGYVDILSSLWVSSSYEKLGLGIALLLHGEQLKLAFVHKLIPILDLKCARSIIRDSSVPPGWTRNAALIAGYKPRGKYGDHIAFEKLDYIDPHIGFFERVIGVRL